MAWTGLALTVDGRNALNRAQLSGRMNIKSIVVGDGEAPANFSTRKDLVHRLYEITDLKVDVGDSECTITADIPQVDYDYYFREIGVVVVTDEGEILYVYDNCSDSAQYIVSTTGIETTRKRIRLSLNISDVAEITVENSGILYVAYDDYEETVHRMDAEIKLNEKKAADHFADKDNPHEVTAEQLELENVDNTSDMDKPVSIAQQSAIDAAKKQVSDSLGVHTKNTSNPHHVTKAQVGLGNADNTADADKPVSGPQQTALDALYQQMTAYTQQKIADLINGAPESLDTLKEVSDAIAAHKNIMDALDAAIGKKASAAEFDSHTKDTTKHITATERTKWNAKMETTGDSANNTATFTTGDATNPTGWADIAAIASGEKHSSLMRKFSLAVKNVRYLWKLLGSTSLAGIGDGTVTGAINALNTGCATQTFPVNYTYGGSDGEANNGISTTEVAIFGRLFVRIKLPYDIKVAANNSVIFKLKMNSDDYLNKLLVPGYDVETCYMYDTNNELVPVTVTANAVANNASISFAARTYTITNSHNTELHSVQWRTIPVYFKLFQE